PIGSSLRHFLASIEGPPASPYEGGIYHLLISVPNRYPISPPRCRFLTRIYHPNIDSRGEVCIEILDLESVLWSPAISISRLLLSIISILDDPGVEDPLVPEIAEVYIQDRQQYDQNARAYTQRYA
ncbi:ubiquitin-conjugating enzyme-like protein, partial [Polyplosphaeria fusca]